MNIPSVSEIGADTIRRLQFVLTDIDDTLTQDGKLLPEAYTSLWELYKAGIKVIPVTGRPAGWCDCIIRQWPVDAVVGENGAFTLYYDGTHLVTKTHPEVSDENEAQKKLEAVKERVLQAVPGSRIAKDQFSRRFDLAIDFREDPPDLGYPAARKIKEVCESMGAQAKISSIHVNTWFGDYSKVDMARIYLETEYGLSLGEVKEQVLFVGDSPNDEPMFEFFPNSVGVANILEFSDDLITPPSYITASPFGIGFAETAAHILKMRS